MEFKVLENKISKIMVDFTQINLVYLFGSRVSGQADAQSDYDFAIAVDRTNDYLKIQTAFQHTIVSELKIEKVDVVILNRAPVELAFAVIRDGQLLYNRDEAFRIEFESAALNKYMDYLPYLRETREQILEGGAFEKRVQRYREAFGRSFRPSRPAGTS